MKPLLEVIKSEQANASFHFLEVKLSKKVTHWHFHPDVELTYVINGEGTRLVGDHIGHFRPGDLMITGENLPHDFNMASADQTATILVIQFKQEIFNAFPELEEVSKLLLDAKRGVVFNSLSSEITALLMSFGDKNAAEQIIALFELMRQISLIEPRDKLCSDLFNASPIGGAQLSRLNKVLDFVNQHYGRAIELKEMAELTFMTEPSFCRWFKQTMDTSFVNYLNKCRIEQASLSLVNTELKVAIIAANCGFESLSSFNRAFKKYKLTSPLKYRQQFKV